MKRCLAVVVLLLMSAMVLSGCSDSTIKAPEPPQNADVETTNKNESSDIPEYVQQIYDRYSENVEKHGALVAKISPKIRKANSDTHAVFYPFSLIPAEHEPSNPYAQVSFASNGSQTFDVFVKEPTPSYLEELLALTLLVIEPEMGIGETKETVEKLITSFYRDGKSDKVVIGDYTVYIEDVYLSNIFISVRSTKTAFDVYDFDKSLYQHLTYNIYTSPASFEDKQFYIEGMCEQTADGMISDIVDEEGNHFVAKYKEYWFYEGMMCRLYGKLKTDVYGEPYFYVEYPYGL